MKPLIVFYSRSGSTKKVARELAALMSCGIDEILDVQSRKGVSGYLRSGKEAMKKIIPEILPAGKNPEIYDLVIIGTPVWGWSLSSPVRAYALKNKEKFKRVAFFCTMGGSGGKNAFAELKGVCGKEPVALLELRTAEMQKPGYALKLKGFADQIAKSIAASEKAMPRKNLKKKSKKI